MCLQSSGLFVEENAPYSIRFLKVFQMYFERCLLKKKT